LRSLPIAAAKWGLGFGAAKAGSRKLANRSRADGMQIPDYEILRTIGKGGMAIVYLASHRTTGRQVVLKVLLDHDHRPTEDLDGNPLPDSLSRSDRLEREGRVIASLRHPGIVRVFEAGEARGVPYIAMEYLEGGDLQSRIGAGLSPDDAPTIAAAVADALHYAHGKGLVHRDVKPANILFRGDGRPVLGDFGIAKQVGADLGLTSTGLLLGSPHYMSPEQVHGDELDGRSDVYGLGVILFEMLAGRRPYEGKSAMSVLMQHVQGPVPRLPEPHTAYQPVIDAMLAKDPCDRYESAELVGRALRGLRRQETGVEVSGGAPRRAEAVTPEAAIPPEVPRALVEHLRAGIREDLEHDRLVLPSLPDVAVRVKVELERPEVSVARIVSLVGSDPALSVQLLRVANSAFYAGTVPVSDVRRAVVRLGNKIVHHVVMMLVVGQLFHARSSSETRAALHEIWQHSTYVAALAEAIARRLTKLAPDVAMLGGLIHRVGALPILDWAAKVPHLLRSPAALQALIEELHPQVGAELLERWNSPPDLVEVARDCRTRSLSTLSPDRYVDVVALARGLARATAEADLDLDALAEPPRMGDRALGKDELSALVETGRENAEILRGPAVPP
jgi:serine/threonine protein kinase